MARAGKDFDRAAAPSALVTASSATSLDQLLRAPDENSLRSLLRSQRTEMNQFLSGQHEELTSFFGDLLKDGDILPPKPRTRKGSKEPPRHPRLSKGSAGSQRSDYDRMLDRVADLPGVPQIEQIPQIPSSRPQMCYIEDTDVSVRPFVPPLQPKEEETEAAGPWNAKEVVKNVWAAAATHSKENIRARLFPKAEEEMRKHLKSAKQEQEYDVVNLYKKSGFAQAIARSYIFEFVTYTVIFLNTVWIGIETDENTADILLDAPVYVQVMEHLFCTYFFCELLIRTLAFERKRDAFGDGWYVFDSLLVTLMVFETWILTIIFGAMGGQPFRNMSVLRAFRIVRLTKSARMLRLMRAFPELMILMKGILVASRSVFFVLCLLVIIIYLFAIAFTQLLRGTAMDARFNNVATSMWTLLLDGIFADLAPILRETASLDWQNAVLMLVFILLTTLTVINLLIGVLVQVVDVVATVENEKIDIRYVKTALMNMIEEWDYDEDGNRGLTHEEFIKVLLRPDCYRILGKLDVDTMDIISLMSSVLFFPGREVVPFGEIMEFILQLRGNNVAKVRNVEDVRLHTSKKLDTIHETINAHIRNQESLFAETDAELTETV